MRSRRTLKTNRTTLTWCCGHRNSTRIWGTCTSKEAVAALLSSCFTVFFLVFFATLAGCSGEADVDVILGEYSEPEKLSILRRRPELISEMNEYGDNLTILASMDGHNILLGKCLGSGKADVNRFNAPGTTALAAAVMTKNRVAFDILIDYGADVNASDGVALLWAVAVEDVDVIKRLLSLGADPELRNLSGESPKSRAETMQNNEILDLLTRDRKGDNTQTPPS